MASSKAKTVDEYLAELPEERRRVVSLLCGVVREHLPEGYQERMNWGMISWEIPLERYPNTYNKQPLAYAALAAQKNHYSLYLMCVYDGSDRAQHLTEAFGKAGKKLDMGKSCVRFKRIEDLHLPAIAKVIGEMPPEAYIEVYERSRVKR